MVQAVLDALSAPEGGGDLRTRPQRYHDALAEAAAAGPAELALRHYRTARPPRRAVR
jgi:hypothetical protein